MTGASRDGDKRESCQVPLKLDTGSSHNLISLDLLKALRAQLLPDEGSLTGAEGSSLTVEGGALIWLTWTGEDGRHRKELIYCLVVQVLAYDLIVSEDRDPDLFADLRNARGEWVYFYSEIVAPVLDALKPQERKELERKRQKILAEAKAKQEAKDAAYAEQRKHGS